MHIQPYLFFEGRADEAIDFYQKTLGAKLVMRVLFKDNPEGAPPNPAIADNVMHARLQIGDSARCSPTDMAPKARAFRAFR